MQKQYKVSLGGRIPKDKVQIYGETIDQIIEETEELVSPELIVQNAKKKRSPLHDFFTWDDTEAAIKYRIQEANYLLRHITVVVKFEGSDEEEDIKAFPNIKITQKDCQEQGYTTMEIVKKNTDYLDVLIEDAHNELTGWRNRYKQYRDLQKFETKFLPVFEVVEAL